MRLFLILCSVALFTSVARAGDINRIDYNIAANRDTWRDDTVITSGTKVKVTDLYIDDAIVVENHGELAGNIHVGDDNCLYLRNTGQINATYDIGDNAGVVQLVHGVNDLTDIGGGFDILVQNADSIALRDLFAFVGNRDVTLQDSEFTYSGGVISHGDAPIRLLGKNIIYIDGIDGIGDGPILSGLMGGGTVSLEVRNVPSMYLIESRNDRGNLYVYLTRETDYIKVLGTDDGRGDFLNKLREYNSDDKFLAALDGALTRDELDNVMRRSARMRPIKMMVPVRALNLLDMHGASGIAMNAVGAHVVMADDADIYGASLRVAGNVTDSISVGGTLRAGMMEYASDMDEFSAYMVASAVDANYQGRRFMMRGRIGTMLTMFDVGPVWDGGGVENNPMGRSYYAAMDVGSRVINDDKIIFTPFVGVMYDAGTVMNSDYRNFNANVGADFGFVTSGYNINYEYFARGRVASNGDVMATMRIGAVSAFDATGGGIEVSRIFSDTAASYEFKVDVRFVF